MWKAMFAIIFLFLIAIASAAQEKIDISGQLTLDQCIAIAFEKSSSIRTANFNLESVGLDLEDAKSEYWPQVNASGQYQFSDRVDFGWERENYNAQVTGSYNIWDHGRRRAGLAQAKINAESARADYNLTGQELVFSITEAYYDLLQAGKLINVYEKLLEISKTNVEKAIAFVEAGRSIPADVAAAKVQQANDELSLINTQNNLELARARLASLMGLDPGTPIEVQDDPDYETYIEASLVTQKVSLEDSMTKAIENRPELSKLRNRLTSLEWSLKLTQLDRWPILTSECSYNILLDDYLRDRENFKQYRSWQVLGRLSFPIFDGGLSKRREQKAMIAVDQMKENISEQERRIILEVQQTYLTLEKNKKNLDIVKEQVRNATESLNVNLGRYEQNMIIFLEVLSAQVRYAQSLTNQVQAFYDYKIAEKSLNKAIGMLIKGN